MGLGDHHHAGDPERVEFVKHDVDDRGFRSLRGLHHEDLTVTASVGWVVHPDDAPRFKALGATANLQPYWAAHEPQMDDLTIPFLDPALAGRQYPFGDLHRAGARLAGGSDWPVTTPDPLQGIHVAVNRIHHGDRAESFLPNQKLDLRTALTAYTAGSAYVNRLDDTGSIRPGFRADLIVLDRDIFDAPASEIGDARVEMTFVDGKPV